MPPQMSGMVAPTRGGPQQLPPHLVAAMAPKGKAPQPKMTSADMAKRNDKKQVNDPFARTAARTGTSFDMADLITHGHALKVPPKLMPSTATKMSILAQTEQTMPGDVRGPFMNPDTAPVVDRMARLIRARNLDLLNLMDDFLKRPRGSRMPIRNRAFLDVSTFRRALCYAFGDQWTGLNMTTEEFEGIWKKYERKDVSHSYAQSLDTSGSKGAGYQGGGAYGQGQGQPESLILWQPFAQDMHRYVYGDNRREEEKALVEAEIALMAQSEAAEEAALGAHDADDNLGDAKARLAARNAKRAAEAAKPIGQRGCTVGQISHAKALISQTLTGPGGKYDTVREALRDIDNSGDGILSREEVKLLLNEHFLMKYVDFYTGLVRGQLDEVVVDTLLDLVDKNGDGEIKCDEFAKEVLGGSNTYFFSDMADGYQSTFDVQGL